MADVKTHEGSCHCGAVAYEVDMSLDGLIECNCSHCFRKGFVLGFVAPDAFRLKAEGPQTEYLFNKSSTSATASARPAASRPSPAAQARTERRWWRSTSAP